MNFQYAFEKLQVWQEARTLTKEVYIITNDFPDYERFGLISQLRRAVISVASNISEGSGRKNKKDQQHFYDIAYSSLMEVINQLILSADLKYLEPELLEEELRPKCHSLSGKLYALKTN